MIIVIVSDLDSGSVIQQHEMPMIREDWHTFTSDSGYRTFYCSSGSLISDKVKHKNAGFGFVLYTVIHMGTDPYLENQMHDDTDPEYCRNS
jgi:hypothetical protein